ncbi:hypothetical protein B0H15DRAFT_892038 [Mycena belliarum]|uniref:MYND-type domain-containing protein n=1 Tax=Mycena belliarum TaxID=1033014 RepID=A0AAD6TYG7_9AGAR|nr:hypothetical protein B0H15DRAFT_892038 [Mycena belliae]
MGFGDSPKSPSFQKDRRGWNAAWERDLATLYGSAVDIAFAGRRPITSLASDLPTEAHEMMLADANVLNVQIMTTQICTLQRDLTRKAAKRFAEDDFESHWTTRCSVKQREEFILEGLVRACDASPDFEEHRKWCPELTLKRLNHASGRGYLDLLKKLTLQDLDTIPNDFKTVPNVVYDAIHDIKDPNPHPGQVLGKKAGDSGRTYLLTMVVWNILLAFYGESENYGLVKGQRDDPKELKRMGQMLGGEVDVKGIIRETAANRLRGERHCTSCGLPAEKAGVATLVACQRCKAIDRLIFYCSKDCQVVDWKTGHPPHKTICGKKGAIAEALLAPKAPEPANDDDDWPPPSPGYTRSPALLHQLKLLKENPETDYVLVQPHPHPDHGVILQDAMGSLFFKLSMTRAVCEHAPSKVLMMYEQLEPTAVRAPGFGAAKLKKQLLKEYGVDVDEAKAARDKARS